MNPMPSGGTAEASAEGAGAAGLEASLAHERADLGGAAAMGQAGPAATGEPLGGPGSGAEVGIQATAAIAHSRLAAAATGAGLGAAAGCGQEVVRAVAILQPAAAVELWVSGISDGPGLQE